MRAICYSAGWLVFYKVEDRVCFCKKAILRGYFIITIDRNS